MANLDLANFEGFLDKHGLEYFKSKNDALTDEKIAVETNRATEAENDLSTNLNSHTSNKSNPHGVTKSQVGLGNVDNTSDANKPISTATQTALDKKVDKTTTVNGKALSSNITLSASDVGADASGSADTALNSAKEYTDTSVEAEATRAKSAEATKVDSVKIGTTEYKSGTVVTLPVYTTDEADSTFASDISLSIDTSTYKMTLSLKDNNGTVLSTQSVDFPIESMVVNASYTSGTLTLTLQNGNTLNVDISSIISGLVPDTRTVAGIDLKDNITVAELRTALNVASGAEVNQNAFSNVVVGSTTIAADSKTDSLTLVAGSNVTITPDATNDKITITSDHPTITKDTDTTSSISPSHGNSFTVVDSVTRDENGHVTKVNTKAVKLPTDTKATQTNTTSNADYRVVLSTNANDTTETDILHKSTNFTANPSTGAFFAKGYDRIDITGQTLDVNTLNLSSGSPEIMRYVAKTSGGTNNITGIPVAGHPFILDVELIRWAATSDYITKQTFISVYAAPYEYVRWCTNGTWTDWTRRAFTEVSQKITTTTEYRPLVLGTTANSDLTALDVAVTGETFVAEGLYTQPNTGLLGSKSLRLNQAVDLEFDSSTESLNFVFK